MDGRVGHDLVTKPQPLRKYIHTHAPELFYCTPETNTALSIHYTERLKAGAEGDDRG